MFYINFFNIIDTIYNLIFILQKTQILVYFYFYYKYIYIYIYILFIIILNLFNIKIINIFSYSIAFKFIVLIALLVFVRGGIPRYRYDFLTKIGWIKFLSLILSIFLFTLVLILLF